MEELQYIAFMAHLPIKDADQVLEVLKEYDIGTYLMGLETKPYDHIHFLVQMKEEDYHRFSKRVFKDKYQLRGRAQKGAPRQYGKVKKIDDLEKMKAYTVKCKNVLTNMEQKDLDRYLEKSFIKEERLTALQEIVDDMDRYFNPYITIEKGEEKYNMPMAPTEIVHAYGQDIKYGSIPVKMIRIAAIGFMRAQGYKSITKTKVETIVHHYITQREDITDSMLYDYLYI